MRSLILASFLAVLTFISAAEGGSHIISVDVTVGQTIQSYEYQGCRRLPSLRQMVPINLDQLILVTCLESCATYNYTKGGVGHNTCYCDTVDRGKHLDDSDCEVDNFICPGKSEFKLDEYCGSENSLVLYGKV